MRKLSLTTWERLQLVKCFPQTAPTADLYKYVTLSEKLDLSDSDRTHVGFNIMPDGTASWEDVTWEFEILFEESEYELIAKLVEARYDWPMSRFSLILVEKVRKATSEVFNGK